MSPDVLVVGAGPAGSATALLLARRGWSVRILERSAFPRTKPCGECLSPGAVAAVARLGLLQQVRSLAPAEIEGWEVRSGEASGRGRFPAACGKGLALPRSLLDMAILSAARVAGAEIEEGVTVRSVGPPDAGRGRVLEVRSALGEPATYSGRVLVGADGLRSVVARATGGPRRPPRLRKLSLTLRIGGRRASSDLGLLALSDDVTVGLAPVSAAGNLWNLTLVVSSKRWGRAVAADPLGVALEQARRARLDWTEGPRVLAGPWASGPFDRPMRAVAAEGILLVGDAAGYYDPLTGQGIYRALRSAELAARAIDFDLRRKRQASGSFHGYRRRHAAAFRAGRLVQRAVETTVSRKRWRDLVVKRLGARPDVLSTLFSVTGDAQPAARLLGPDVLAPLLLPPRGVEPR